MTLHVDVDDLAHHAMISAAVRDRMDADANDTVACGVADRTRETLAAITSHRWYAGVWKNAVDLHQDKRMHMCALFAPSQNGHRNERPCLLLARTAAGQRAR